MGEEDGQVVELAGWHRPAGRWRTQPIEDLAGMLPWCRWPRVRDPRDWVVHHRRGHPVDANGNPKASSNQPTGCAGRRLANTAPTVAAVTPAITSGGSKLISSGRPAWTNSRCSQKAAARPSRASAHSAHGSAASHRGVRARRGAGITTQVLGACSSPPSPPSDVGHLQGGRCPSGQRYGRRADRRPSGLVDQAAQRQISSATGH
jgi:hypothetical protein